MYGVVFLLRLVQVPWKITCVHGGLRNLSRKCDPYNLHKIVYGKSSRNVFRNICTYMAGVRNLPRNRDPLGPREVSGFREAARGGGSSA